VKTQKLTIRDVILGLDAALRIAREEKAGDYKVSMNLGRVQRKALGLVGEGTPYEYAKMSLLRQMTRVVKMIQPDGSEGEQRIFDSDETKQKFEDQLIALQAEECTLPIGFIKPQDLAALKLDRPVSGAEMAGAWWLFDPAAMEALEQELEAEG